MIIDVGALVDGYHSDMTRTFVVGEPTRRAARRLRPRARRPARRPRRRSPPVSRRRDVDAACRDLFAGAGYADWFIHGTGHGVGLDIHEDPFSSHRVHRRAAGGGRGDRRARPLSWRIRRGPHRGPRRGHRRRRPPAHPPVQGHPMPAITTNDLKTGITLELDNGLFQVVEFQHVKPGKGGAFVRTKLRNVRTGNVARAHVQRRDPRRAGDRRAPGHAVPVPRRRRLRVHEHLDVRPAHGAPRRPRRRRRLPRRAGRSPRSPSTRARSSASRSRRRSS